MRRGSCKSKGWKTPGPYSTISRNLANRPFTDFSSLKRVKKLVNVHMLKGFPLKAGFRVVLPFVALAAYAMHADRL